MQNADLNAEEDGARIASYPYLDRSGRSAEFVLTQSSLIFSAHHHREIFPLKDLRSIGVESGRNIGMLLTLFFGMVLSLGCAAVFGNTIFLQTANASIFMKTVPVGMLVIGLFLLVLLIRLRFVFTRIVIQSGAGPRHYEVAMPNQSLRDFVDRVAQSLSLKHK